MLLRFYSYFHPKETHTHTYDQLLCTIIDTFCPINMAIILLNLFALIVHLILGVCWVAISIKMMLLWSHKFRKWMSATIRRYFFPKTTLLFRIESHSHTHNVIHGFSSETKHRSIWQLNSHFIIISEKKCAFSFFLGFGFFSHCFALLCKVMLKILQLPAPTSSLYIFELKNGKP